jgi:uncharacterized protein
VQGVQAVGGRLSGGIEARLARLDWDAVGRALDDAGHARVPPILTPEDCAGLVAIYDEPARFRSRVDMARYRFGVGEYQYFAEPLPPVVAALRQHAYPPLAAVANRWAAALGDRARYPDDLAAFRAVCARAGQTKPTPLLLRYEADGYNCLHQDLYGAIAFPLQMTVLLSGPGRDFTGGEFLLVEQRPRAQSRGEVVRLAQGEAVIFATRHRPVQGARGPYRATLRHGVSRVSSGLRYTLGVIFHDAE